MAEALRAPRNIADDTSPACMTRRRVCFISLSPIPDADYIRTGTPSRLSGGQLRHGRFGHFEVGGHGLDVVVVVEGVEEFD